MNIPDRVRWALEVVDPGPADSILEIGCGPGVAAALICERLRTGRLLAIDRSPVAVSRASQRNSAHISSGVLTVAQSTLDDLDVSAGSFDKAFSINVNLFWVSDPARELTVLKRVLRPGGVLHVLYGDGPTGADRVTPVISAAVKAHGFVDVKVLSTGVGVSARSPE